ncbi:phosphatase PAP2 family protein, partial [bacterium]
MRFVRLSLSLALVAPAAVAQADPFGSAISGPFTFGYLAAGLGLPLLRDGALGRERSLRVADSLLTTFGATEGLKALVRERRPDGSDHASFPSGHASLAFAVATMEARFHPHE